MRRLACGATKRVSVRERARRTKCPARGSLFAKKQASSSHRRGFGCVGFGRVLSWREPDLAEQRVLLGMHGVIAHQLENRQHNAYECALVHARLKQVAAL